MNRDFFHSGALVSLDDQRVLVGCGKQQWMEKPDAQICFYFPDFFLENRTPWVRFEQVLVMSLQELHTALAQPPAVARLNWEPANRTLFEWQCSDLRQQIERGVLRKGVPYAFERSSQPLTPVHRHACLVACIEKALQRPLALYGFWNEREGMLGATPELLFRQTVGSVQTCAVAGTVKLGEEWQQDAKLKEEHEIVVRAIVEQLSPLGKVVASETVLTPYSQLAHLKTPLQLHSEVPFATLIERLHPTPALGAYPKKEGHAWLKKINEKIPRGRYGAPVGSTKHCYVAIRNVQWNQKGALLGSGCGFVAESDVALEWNELQSKLAAMKEILAL